MPHLWTAAALLLTLASMSLGGCSSSDDNAPAGAPDASAASDALQDGSSADTLEAATQPGDADSSDAAPADGTSTDAQELGDTETEEATMPDAGAGPVLLSLNLHCLKVEGSDFTDNTQRLAKVAEIAAAEGVTAIALQEVCENASMKALDVLHAQLELATGTTWGKARAHAHTAWEGTPDEAQEGLAIVARGALTDVTVVEYRKQSGLLRVAIGATLAPEAGGYRLWSVHLDYTDPAVRLAQARETAALVLAHADPSLDVIIAGDFNAQAGSPSILATESFGFQDLSSSLGGNLIDHVFTHRGSRLRATMSRLAFDGTTQPRVSDHPGVIVGLTSVTPTPVTITRLEAHATLASGDALWLRGNAPSLDWTWGVPAWKVSDGIYRWVGTEIPKGVAFEYKWLRNDEAWQTGANESAAGGDSDVASPAF